MLKPEGPRVVYLLGAGASVNALPVVRDMPDAFRSQDVWLRHFMGAKLDVGASTRYFKYLNELAKKSHSYGTVDTYARALLLKRDLKGVNELKLHLAMFFLLEQAIENKNWLRDTHIIPPPPIPYQRQQRIDTRYFGWLALLLDNKGVMCPRVNVLSWNYDLQLEHALAQYWDARDLQDVHNRADCGIYPSPTGPNDKPQKLPFLTHLNGVAGHLQRPREQGVCLYRQLNGTDPQGYINWLFARYAEYDKKEETMLWGMQDSFNFAWEPKDVSATAQEIARDALATADIFVVIGYSFPSFNRTVDGPLLKAFIDGTTGRPPRRIHIQSPSLTEESFRHMFSLVRSSTFEVKVDSYTDQFYIPPELFT